MIAEHKRQYETYLPAPTCSSFVGIRLKVISNRATAELLAVHHMAEMDAPAAMGQRALRSAAGNGHVAIVHMLLSDYRVDDCDGAALFAAAAAGHAPVILRLLRERPPFSMVSSALRVAVDGGHVGVVAALLAGRPEVAETVDNSLLRAAARVGSVKIVDWFLAQPGVDPASEPSVLEVAVHHRHLLVAERLLADPRVRPSRAQCSAIFSMAERDGEVSIMERLLEDPRCSTDDISAAGVLERAAQAGRVLMVEQLLARPRFNAADSLNRALLSALRRGKKAVVERLLANERVDPRTWDSTLLMSAIEAGNLAVLEKYLADSRVSLAPHSDAFLQTAAHKGAIRLVKNLLADPRVDPVPSSAVLCQIASRSSSGDLLEVFFRDGRMDSTVTPEGRLCLAARDGILSDLQQVTAEGHLMRETALGVGLRLAAERGHEAAVQLLLKRVHSPQAGGNAALRLAQANGHAAVAELLLADMRVNPAVADNRALCVAASEGDIDEVERILALPRVDAATENNTPIGLAAESGHWHVVDSLATLERVREVGGLVALRALCKAAAAGKSPSVELLLRVRICDIAANERSLNAVLAAVEGGHHAIVRRLIRDERVDVTNNGFVAGTAAIQGNDLTMLQAVLSDPRTNPAAVSNTLLDTAVRERKCEMMDYLLGLRAVQRSVSRRHDAQASEPVPRMFDVYAAASVRPVASVLLATLSDAARRAEGGPSSVPPAVSSGVVQAIRAAVWARRRGAILGRVAALARAEGSDVE